VDLWVRVDSWMESGECLARYLRMVRMERMNWEIRMKMMRMCKEKKEMICRGEEYTQQIHCW
jgi:hypothetical protein